MLRKNAVLNPPFAFYFSVCNKGYEGNGKICKPTDPCEIDFPCALISGSYCFNDNGKAICKCRPGFVRQVKDQNNFTAPCYDENTAPVNNCTICDNSSSVCRPTSSGGPSKECVCREGYRRNAAGKCINVSLLLIDQLEFRSTNVLTRSKLAVI